MKYFSVIYLFSFYLLILSFSSCSFIKEDSLINSSNNFIEPITGINSSCSYVFVFTDESYANKLFLSYNYIKKEIISIPSFYQGHLEEEYFFATGNCEADFTTFIVVTNITLGDSYSLVSITDQIIDKQPFDSLFECKNINSLNKNFTYSKEELISIKKENFVSCVRK